MQKRRETTATNKSNKHFDNFKNFKSTLRPTKLGKYQKSTWQRIRTLGPRGEQLAPLKSQIRDLIPTVLDDHSSQVHNLVQELR